MKDSKGYIGIGMNGIIARSYDNDARTRIEFYHQIAKKVADELSDNSEVLEIAPGPGYLSIELAKIKHCRITGLDISKTFVEIARSNARQAGTDIRFRQGNVASMPFMDGKFNFIMCTSAFKNFRDPVRALQEMCRVLKPAGKALIVDLRRDLSNKSINDYIVNTMNVRGLKSLYMKWVFKAMLRPRAYTVQQFKDMASKAAFSQIDVSTDQIGFESLLMK